MADQQCDLAIIGAGIVGLATARELLMRHPTLRLRVIEKETRAAAHQSGHNSGVIHSGIYYAPGSLKARLCVEGRASLLRFCDEHGIPYSLCGKVIVATEERELPGLEELYRRGVANGVPGLEMIGPERLAELEPYSAGIKAIHSPATGIIDFEAVTLAYARAVEAAGGAVLKGWKITAISRAGDRIVLQTPAGAIETRYVVSCAGLFSDRLAALTGAADDPRIIPFRGDYFVLRPEKREMVRTLIYPVPDPRFPFLGVHFTMRHDGEVWLGPNAVLAFAREGYRRLDINVRDNWETLTYRGFWAMASKYWRTGFGEMYRDFNKAAFVGTLQRYMPALRVSDVAPGPSGVRAQALARDGRLVDDFVFSQSPNVIHVRNAPSPAATASLAIARVIADRAEESFSLGKNVLQAH